MTLWLMKTNSDSKNLYKTWTNETSYNCEPYENCEILSPHVIMDYSPDITTFNYAYIPDFNRYYFIDGVDVIPGGACILHMHVDVLYTWSSFIRNLNVLVERSENNASPFIADTSIPLSTMKSYEVIRMNNNTMILNEGAVNTDCFILEVAGGAGA